MGRDPSDPHQEFIEIYIPNLADLRPGLNKDALNLTFYDVEGDAGSPGLSLVNYRIDLPSFDLDPSNGLSGLPRPSSGIVVLGWVDYVGNPPTDLAGTPATRLALINGGLTSTTDFTFIAINGNHFSGTTNFPVPVAVSYVDMVSDPLTGKIEQGSGVFLLVNRDDPGYASLCGQTDPGPCNSFPNLPAGTPLGSSSLLDSFAANDDSAFVVAQQPYAAPTGSNIDLEFVLPLGGTFSLLSPQVPETEQGNGYQRVLLDVLKTTEDAIIGNDNPALDAINSYQSISNLGPFRPTPGRSPSTLSPAFLSVSDLFEASAPPIQILADLKALELSRQVFEVLTNTRSRPGLHAANLGGNFGIASVTTPGASSDPFAMNFASHSATFAPLAQNPIAPPISVQTFSTTPAGHTETITVQVNTSPLGVGNPPIENPTYSGFATFKTIDPTTAIDAMNNPYQATAFFAAQGITNEPAISNEFATTSLGQAMALGLGTTFFDSRGNGLALINPLTDLSNPLVVDPMIATIPTNPAFFINPSSAISNLVATVLGSAEWLSGSTTYANSFNASKTLVKARDFNVGSVSTSGGFTPAERIHYANARGRPGEPNSGLTDVLTGRDFELALIDTQLGPTGSLESGATDDFGIAVRVSQTRTGSTFAVGEFIFLATTGGLEGADIDTLDVPPNGLLMTIIYVDLDLLDTLLGVERIDRVFVVDGSGNGEVDIVDVIDLPEPGGSLSLAIGCAFLGLCARHRRHQHHTRFISGEK